MTQNEVNAITDTVKDKVMASVTKQLGGMATYLVEEIVRLVSTEKTR